MYVRAKVTARLPGSRVGFCAWRATLLLPPPRVRRVSGHSRIVRSETGGDTSRCMVPQDHDTASRALEASLLGHLGSPPEDHGPSCTWG
jgi:hypothetical protein